MFEAIPQWLNNRVSELRGTFAPSEHETAYYAAAGWTIAFYLGKNVQGSDADPFFDLPAGGVASATDEQWYAHVNRVILIAETIFSLRLSIGFDEMLRRMRQRPLRSTFVELQTAKQFLKAGFKVEMRKETSVRGQDFDFAADRGEARINVEVTSLEAREYSEKTIRNALGEKRKQVPSEHPAIIYCVLPERWTQEQRDWDAELESIGTGFLRGTRRINAVVFWSEVHLSLAGPVPGGALFMVRKPYFNAQPRHNADLGFLVQGPRSETARYALATGQGLAELESFSYEGEYFRWVDSLVPRAA